MNVLYMYILLASVFSCVDVGHTKGMWFPEAQPGPLATPHPVSRGRASPEPPVGQGPRPPVVLRHHDLELPTQDALRIPPDMVEHLGDPLVQVVGRVEDGGDLLLCDRQGKGGELLVRGPGLGGQGLDHVGEAPVHVGEDGLLQGPQHGLGVLPHQLGLEENPG